VIETLVWLVVVITLLGWGFFAVALLVVWLSDALTRLVGKGEGR